MLNAFLNTAFVLACFRMTIPVLLVALGDLYCERSGVVNIAVEGMMLSGAFFGFLVTYYTQNQALGLLATVVGGFVLGIAHAFLTVTLGCNQIVSALGINIFAQGITTTLNKTYLGVTTSTVGIEVFPNIIFEQNIFTFIAIGFLLITCIIFSKTNWGVSIKAVGINPKAADTVGISVYKTRYVAVIISGIFAALGGAAMTMGNLGFFQENMTAGRGFIAFAAVVFGRYNPMGTVLACFVFGVADAVQLRLQLIGLNIPYQVFLMLPYLVTILLLVAMQKKSFVPKAQGVAYDRTER